MACWRRQRFLMSANQGSSKVAQTSVPEVCGVFKMNQEKTISDGTALVPRACRRPTVTDPRPR